MDILRAKALSDGITKMVVGVVVMRQTTSDPEVLMLKRADWEFMGGMWELPSGGVERGETLNQALHREVEEETGLVIVDLNLSQVETFDYVTASGKRARQFNWRSEARGAILLSEEHQEYRWVKPAGLGALFPPSGDVNLPVVLALIASL